MASSVTGCERPAVLRPPETPHGVVAERLGLPDREPYRRVRGDIEEVRGSKVLVLLTFRLLSDAASASMVPETVPAASMSRCPAQAPNRPLKFA
jgi:hypothetical protein